MSERITLQRYTAFISYNSSDSRWAKWLQQRLEHYHLPSVIANEKGEVLRSFDKKSRHFRIFRYESDLAAQNLDDGLKEELDKSQYLIVVCSPRSAVSPWVGQEIRHFIDTGRRKNIIPFIIEGKPYSNDETECFNKELKNAFPEKTGFSGGSLLGVDVNDSGDDLRLFRKRRAIAKMVSILVGLPESFTFLWNRYRRRYVRSLLLKVLIALGFLLALFFTWQANRSFSVSVSLSEQTPANHYLPLPDNIRLKLFLGDEEKSLTLNSIADTESFLNIPGSFAGTKARLVLQAEGYRDVDTLITLSRSQHAVVGIRRDDTYGLLAGHITDGSRMPVEGAIVECAGLADTTAADGSFLMMIPIERQRPLQEVRIHKRGYCDQVFNNNPVSDDWQVMLTPEEEQP